jgi:2-keto-4-pentenoate hydratase
VTLSPSLTLTSSLTDRADALLAAGAPGQPVEPFSRGRALDMAEAVAVRDRNLAQRRDRGERLVGAKVALVSPEAQARAGADEPIFGWLTDAMEVPDGSAVPLASLHAPRIEAELVFVLGEELVGPGIGPQDVLAATAGVCVGLDISSTRYDSRGTATDAVADNASAGAFVVGPPTTGWRSLDLSLTGVLIERNGEVFASGAGAAILGHPARAVAVLANQAARAGMALPAGFVVFTGAVTEPADLAAGFSYEAHATHLGRVGVRVV